VSKLLIPIMILQVLCAVHAVRTGRSRYWIFIVIAFPLLGCIVYAVSEIIPDFLASRTGRRAAAKVVDTIDPDRELRRLQSELDTAETLDNKRLLAEEHLRRGENERAIALFESAVASPHGEDAALLLGLARAQFAAGLFGAALGTLDRVKIVNPKFESAEAHLLYARALEGEGRRDEAVAEYSKLANYYPGPEAKCRYGLLLQQLGRSEAALNQFHEVVRGFERSGGAFREAQREWYEIARRNVGA
jgi:hypothetical protein